MGKISLHLHSICNDRYYIGARTWGSYRFVDSRYQHFWAWKWRKELILSQEYWRYIHVYVYKSP